MFVRKVQQRKKTNILGEPLEEPPKKKNFNFDDILMDTDNGGNSAKNANAGFADFDFID